MGIEDFRKAGILRQKAVAGMHRIGADDLTGGQQAWDVEVGIARLRWTDTDTLIGEPDMHGIAVGG